MLNIIIYNYLTKIIYIFDISGDQFIYGLRYATVFLEY